MLYSKHRLPPAVIADLIMRPTKSNREALDARTVVYLGVLMKLRVVDVGAVLRALERYSSLHGEVGKGSQEEEDQEMGGNGDGKKGKRRLPGVRWRSSYAAEEIVFWRLIKAVSTQPNSNAVAGGGDNKNKNDGGVVGIRHGGDAVAVLKAVTLWMALFTEAATAFSRDAFGTIHTLQAKGEIENSRAAFLLLLLGIVEHPTVVSVLSRDGAKGMY